MYKGWEKVEQEKGKIGELIIRTKEAIPIPHPLLSFWGLKDGDVLEFFHRSSSIKPDILVKIRRA
jgi:hypothetical protein